jgi:HEAT repeat protein
MALARTLDERGILPVFNRLDDSDYSVRRTTIHILCFGYPREYLKKHTSTAIPVLIKYSKRFEGFSHLAVSLIGEISDRSLIQTLKDIQQEALELENTELIKNKSIDKWRWLPDMKKSLTKALARLGDKDATDKVLESINKEDIESRAFGIEAIVYSERKDLVKKLLPLLDDTRDAMNIRPYNGDRYMMRVNDLAANAASNILKLRDPVGVYEDHRYTDERINEIKTVLKSSN